MKLDMLSLPELLKIQADIGDAVTAKKAIEADKIKAAVADTIEKSGFTLADVFGDGVKWKRPVSAKYRDPKSGKTWTGRGRAPNWMPKRKSDYTNVEV